MSSEIDKAKIQIKENISTLINNSRLEEAKSLMNEYKKMVPDDIEVYSIDAVILMTEGKFEEAQEVLKDGIIKDDSNFDLLYNLAYLYEQQNNISEALALYNIARIISDDKEEVKILERRIDTLGGEIKKYKVILYGELDKCLKLKQEFQEWDVVGIYDYNRVFNTIPDKNLKKYNCDFIFVVDEVNKEEFIKKINKKLIGQNIYFFEDFKISVIEGLDYKISNLLSRRNINGIITGLSYAEVGIKEDLLSYNFTNLAFSAQDLYYDFLLLKYVHKFKEVKNTLKYVIINLSYYSFDYDMTKTIAKYRIHRYYKYLEEYHNNYDVIGINITKSFYEKRVTFNEYINMNKMKENMELKSKDINGEYEALRNSTMDYKNTRNEYENILNEYLLFLEKNNIKPIVVVCPTSSYYRKYFDESNKKDMFYNIISKFKERYNIQVIDYFKSDVFDKTDFWDYSHLNGKGADKFTRILNDEIIW